MALTVIFALSIIDVATKDHGHLFRFPQYENLDNPYNKIRLFSDTQRHTGAAALVYKRYRLHGDGSAHDRATDLDSSTTSQHACRVLRCNRHLWQTMLDNSTSTPILSFSFSWFLFSKTESKPASKCFHKERNIFKASKTTTKNIRISCWLSY